jgi:hypothetical protein
MTELGPEARALIDDASGVDAPSASDREKVRARLGVQLGVAAVGAAASVAATKAGATGAGVKAAGSLFGGAGTLLAVKVLVGVVLATAVTAGVVLRGRHASATHVVSAPPVPTGNGADARAAAPLTPAGSLSGAPAASAVPASPDAHIASRATHPRVPAHPPAGLTASPPSAPSADAVEGEAALFAKVHAAIDSGNGAAALELLDRHERLYPDGVLADQRAVERVLALCTVGRVSASREAAERFLVEHPRSSQAAHVRRACGVP